MTETDKIAAINRYVDAMYDHEIAFWNEHNPAKLAGASQADLEAFRSRLTTEAVKKAGDILAPSRLMTSISRGAFHPSNKATRRLFTDLTGLALPGTVSGTDKVLREYVGAEMYDGFYVAREDERETIAAERKAADERKESERIENLKCRFASGAKVTGDELVDLAHSLSVPIHPRTVGTLRKRVAWIDSSGTSFGTGRFLPATVGRIVASVSEALK